MSIYIRPFLATILLFASCDPEGADKECGEGEYKTIDGDCVADDEGDGKDWDTGDSDGWWDSGDWRDTGEADVDVDVDTERPEVEYGWDEESLFMYVWSADEHDWTLGLAEASDEDDEWTGWTGEDCLEGDTDESGEYWIFCHPIESDAELWLNVVDSPELIVEGETTLMSFDMEEENHIAYALWNNDTGECWTWGPQSWYYESFAGCEEL